MNKARLRTFESDIEKHRVRRCTKTLRAAFVKVLIRTLKEQKIIVFGGSYGSKSLLGYSIVIDDPIMLHNCPDNISNSDIKKAFEATILKRTK